MSKQLNFLSLKTQLCTVRQHCFPVDINSIKHHFWEPLTLIHRIKIAALLFILEKKNKFKGPKSETGSVDVNNYIGK